MLNEQHESILSGDSSRTPSLLQTVRRSSWTSKLAVGLTAFAVLALVATLAVVATYSYVGQQGRDQLDQRDAIIRELKAKNVNMLVAGDPIIPAKPLGNCEHRVKELEVMLMRTQDLVIFLRNENIELKANNTALKDANAALQTQVADLKMQVYKLTTEVNSLMAANAKLTEDLKSCTNELQYTRSKLVECAANESTLRDQIKVIPQLALEQAKLQLLMQETGYGVSARLVYNASYHGFDTEEMINEVGQLTPTVAIVTTDQGYVFGGSISIPWAISGGMQKDAKAFTFSSSKVHVCPVRAAENAVYFGAEALLRFGDVEFMINRSTLRSSTGKAESDKSYNCNAQDPRRFYSNGTDFRVSNVYVYHVVPHKQ